MRLTPAAPALAALVLLAGGAGAQPLPPGAPELIAAEARAQRGCEGTGDPAVIREQCALRDRLSGRLAQAGYCWGRKGQTDAKREWHACGADSIYADDVEAAKP